MMSKFLNRISLPCFALLLLYHVPGAFFPVSCHLRAQELTALVSPFIGTGGHGHTFPGATMPFGMVQLSPDTRVSGWDACGGYHYSDSLILGFSHTHLSGTGVADYGDILVMPASGPVLDMEKAFHFPSRFRHADETASPGYYSVMLEDPRIKAELTATRRVGFHRYTFERAGEAEVLFDLKHGLGPDRVIASELRIVSDTELVGMRRSSGWATDQVVYFVARFSKSATGFSTLADGAYHDGYAAVSGKDLKSRIRFTVESGERLVLRVALSSVSIEGARKNLEMEAPGGEFDQVRRDAREAWEEALGTIRVEGGSPTERIIFYTALYHAMIAPNLFSDVDGRYRGMDGANHTAEGFDMYTVFSLWDTFRAEHPLLTIIDPDRTRDFIQSLIAKQEESGILPVWELAANETWCMIGYHSVPVIVDAYLKGIRGFDAGKALEAMKQSASRDHFGLKAYRESGFIPGEAESESVSKTLEYAYDDWCIARMAAALGEKKDAEIFGERAQFFRNLFDRETGFFRPRINGGWLHPFDPRSVTVHYTEANPFQYNFFVPHAVTDLVEMHGGPDSFRVRLDRLFSGPSELTGRRQSDITGLIGQYAHGNEPSHHMAYLHNYIGVPSRTQELVRLIMDSLYTEKPDGLCGNDDCGQMSAWYVFSAMGFYPVCPGLETYCIGSPVFDRVTIMLKGGAPFVIETENNSSGNRYVVGASYNGKDHRASWFRHGDLAGGGILRLKMSGSPDPAWGTGKDDVARSMSAIKDIVTTPVISAAGRSFRDTLAVRIYCDTPGAAIHYTTDGTEPSPASRRYEAPFILRKSTTVKAISVGPGKKRSRRITAEFLKSNPVGTITIGKPYSEQYSAGGNQALVDGIRGTADFRLGAWQGYERNDLDLVVDLGSEKEITEVRLGCLQDINSWIFFPTQVEFSFSNDNIDFADGYFFPNNIPLTDAGSILKEFGTRISPRRARYVRIVARNIGFCPEWHKGAGGRAWIFADEIIIQTR